MPRWTRNRLKNLIGLLLAPIVAYGLLRWFEHRQVYQPYATLQGSPDTLGVPWQEVWLTTGDGVRLHAWHLRASTRPDAGQRVVLVCHGNGGNISHRLDLYTLLLDLGLDVLAFDYRGYGRSQGRPSEEGTYRDAQAALAWLRDRGHPPDRILALGESLGGGVAVELGRRETLGGVILQSTFTSVPDLGAEIFPWLPVRSLGTIRYDNLAKLGELPVPVLILHSRADTIIPFHHGERLRAVAPAATLFRELRGDHNDALVAGYEEYGAALSDFLQLLDRPAAEWPRWTRDTP